MEVQPAAVTPPASPASGQEQLPTGKPARWLLPALIGLSCIYPFVGEQLVTACREIFYPPPHGQMMPPPEYSAAVLRAMLINTVIGYGLCGALFFTLLGGLVGAASGAGRTLRGALIGGGVGLVLAAVAGAIGYQVENYLLQADLDAMYRTGMVLIAEFMAFAVAGGLIAQLVGTQLVGSQGGGSPAGGATATLRTIGTALFVAVAVLVAYILTATIAMPTGWTEGMYPTELSVRYLFFFFLSMSGSVTVAVLLLFGDSRGRKDNSATQATDRA